MRIAVGGATGTVGRHVEEAARRRGHDTVAMSRSTGVDLTTGSGLAPALDGVDLIIDATNAPTFEETPATEFFTAVAEHLQSAAAEQGAQRIVTLSIVGIDEADFGYYRAKLAHERTAGSGRVPAQIVRATPLHELPVQMMAKMRDDGRVTMFDVRAQTVAAAAVGEALVEAAERPIPERRVDLAGPEPENLVDMARSFVRRRGVDLEVKPDTETMSGVPDGALVPGADATIVGPTFAEWLRGADAQALEL